MRYWFFSVTHFTRPFCPSDGAVMWNHPSMSQGVWWPLNWGAVGGTFKAQGTLCLANVLGFQRRRRYMRKVCDYTVVPPNQSTFNSRSSFLLWNISTFSGQWAFPMEEAWEGTGSLIEITSKNLLMKYYGQILNIMTCGSSFSSGKGKIIWGKTQEKTLFTNVEQVKRDKHHT